MKSNDASYLKYLIYITIYLLAISIPTHLFGLSKLAFLVLPLPLFFINNDPFKFFICFLICFLAFFEAYLPTSNVFGFLHPQDSILIVFMILFLLKKKNLLVLELPYSTYLLTIYIFIAYTILMTVPSIMKMGFDSYVLQDLKIYLYLLIIGVFLQTDLYLPKNIIRVFLIISVYSSFWALFCIFTYLKSWERIITWNEIYFGLSVTIGLIVFKILKNKRMKYVLITTTIINIIALVLTQTRGVWLSTLLSIAIYLILDLKRSGVINSMKQIIIGSIAFFVLFASLSIFINFNILSFVEKRFSEKSKTEFIDPSASMGYRIYESYTVYKKRTFFGHGSGARIYLYTPFFKKWTTFWAIHSEYFEVLHKYGFAGLSLLIIILVLTFRRLLEMCLNKKILLSTIGQICFCCFINLVFVSITSGYLSRTNIMFFLVFLFGIANNYGMRPNNRVIIPQKKPEIPLNATIV